MKVLFSFVSVCLLFLETVRCIEISDLLDDFIEISSSESSSIAVAASSVPQGWLTQDLYSGSSCRSNSLFVSLGLIINQCLFSPRNNVYFRISCGSATGLIYYYSDSNCKNFRRDIQSNPRAYSLNTCFQYGSFQNTYFMRCLSTSSTNSQSLPLPTPTTKNLVTYSYYQDNSCSTIVQYTAYAEGTCIAESSGKSVKYNYPSKTAFASSTCSGTSSVSELQANTCFNWVTSYGYGDDDGTNPYSPYLVIAEYAAGSASPSPSPTFAPSFSPTISLEPTITASPTVTQTSKPTSSPTLSRSPTINPKSPTRKPTKSVTPAPTTLNNYQIKYNVKQTFSNFDCSLFLQASVANLLQTTITLTLIGSTTTSQLQQPSLLVQNITPIASSSSLSPSCNISYELTIVSTEDLGYASAGQAYDITIWRMLVAVANGDFNDNWASVSSSNSVSVKSIDSTWIGFGGYSSQVVPGSSQSNGSSSSSSNSSLVIILSVFFCLLVCLPLLIYLLLKIYRYFFAHNKVFVGEGNQIEMVDARYIEVSEGLEGVGGVVNVPVASLPQARPVSCIIAQVENC